MNKDQLKMTEFTTVVRLTPEQVKETCRDYVEKMLRNQNMQKTEATTVHFNVGAKRDDPGYELGGFPSYELHDVTVTVKQSKVY